MSKEFSAIRLAYATFLLEPYGRRSRATHSLDAVHHGRHENLDGTTTLWRPVGPIELIAEIRP